MIFQMMPLAMAVLHNERLVREVAGLKRTRPGGLVRLHDEFRKMSAAGTSDDIERRSRARAVGHRSPAIFSKASG